MQFYKWRKYSCLLWKYFPMFVRKKPAKYIGSSDSYRMLTTWKEKMLNSFYKHLVTYPAPLHLLHCHHILRDYFGFIGLLDLFCRSVTLQINKSIQNYTCLWFWSYISCYCMGPWSHQSFYDQVSSSLTLANITFANINDWLEITLQPTVEIPSCSEPWRWMWLLG